ncbi:MAG: aminodeoxychorismate/anthranilate synthase component II [Bacteriovoracaceae bacterium]
MKAVLCDFEDSFTYNIYCELVALGVETRIMPLEKTASFLESNINTSHKLAVVLGPGPGHPDERPEIITALKKIMNRQNMFLLGVCLGHQLAARALGLKVQTCVRPVHGEVEKIFLKQKDRKALGFETRSLEVQRYNSLAAPLDEENLQILNERGLYWLGHKKEIYVLKKENLLTYQFHPESVGTSFRSLFFTPLKTFLL